MSHPSHQTLKDWMWPPENDCGPEVIFHMDPAQEDPSQDEGTWGGQVRCSVEGGAAMSQE